jgi:hypothetical protein
MLPFEAVGADIIGVVPCDTIACPLKYLLYAQRPKAKPTAAVAAAISIFCVFIAFSFKD